MLKDYILELRRKTGTITYNLLGVLSGRIQPSLTREMGMADQLTFNLQLSDPLALQFDGSPGLEVWLYGTDWKFKQAFIPVSEEFTRDYGASSMGSGSGGLGSGSGDTMLVTCEGPESYLTRYVLPNYKISQRLVSDILSDILVTPHADGTLSSGWVVDPSLNVPLDIDLSWENLQTAVNNIIAQTGGYVRIVIDPDAPQWRALYLDPIPGQLPTPQGIGTNSAVLPQ